MSTLELILLLVLSFLPPIFYTIWIRNTETYHREAWIAIGACFLWGATISVIAALILEILLNTSITITYTQTNLIALISVVIIAPICEELAKPLSFRIPIVKKNFEEPEDGLIYGAIAGLGFSATENLIYGIGFLQEGILLFIILMLTRSFGGCILHASATALTGYGYGQHRLKHTRLLTLVPYLIIAILLHSAYNFLLSIPSIGTYGGLLLAFAIITVTMILIRKTIKRLDQQNK